MLFSGQAYESLIMSTTYIQMVEQNISVLCTHTHQTNKITLGLGKLKSVGESLSGCLR